MSEIISGLFVGSQGSATEGKFKAVINCTEELNNIGNAEIYMNVPLKDYGDSDYDDALTFYKAIKDVKQFIANYKLIDQIPLLVHCQMGVSRSTNMTVAILLLLYPTQTIQGAYVYVKQQRAQAFSIGRLYERTINEYFGDDPCRIDNLLV